MIKDVILANENVKPNSKEIEILKKYFPACFDGDGNFKIDRFQEIIKDKVDITKEGYELKFLGKSYAKLIASLDTDTVIEPDIEHNSKPENSDSENIYISGDNIDGLKHLLKSYENKIKCIYIDPPYNTGLDDFAYNDKFSFTENELVTKLSISEEEAKRIIDITNKGSRSHSAWLMFMYSRLLLARDLLGDDGVIFISIDDNEQANLKLLCDDVFGEENFVNCIAVKMSEVTGVKMNHAKMRFPKLKEYILFYKRSNFQSFVTIDKYKIEKWDKENNLYLEGMTKEIRNLLVELTEKEGNIPDDVIKSNQLLSNIKIISLSEKLKEIPYEGEELENWLFENSYRIIKTAGSDSLVKIVYNSPQITNQDIASAISSSGVLFFYITNFNRNTSQPRLRVIFADENIYKNPCDFWQDIKTSGAISNEGGVKYCNGKKPLKLLNRLIKMTTKESDIILDFFSGSATTAHAVMKLNAEDGGNRKFIMVQLQEINSKDSEHYKTIDEIGIARIKNASKEIKKEHPETTADLGFKHFTLKEPTKQILDKIEEFTPQKQETCIVNDVNYDAQTILTTWLVKDGYGFIAKPKEIEFDGYIAYYFGKHLYLINRGITSDQISDILDKIEDDDSFSPENIVVFGYSFLWIDLEELKNNIQKLNIKDIHCNVEVRY